ncbi:PREDICTED: glycine-rich cell wall structural protein 1-like [Ipomoea nil]|uniref:glycine-rich cell wall structural protein 1-like n=1 Tax=Ipomoea nil TaxID=35883 RepID=UPI0009019F95|nr:PREDICTED: glycine-rich cell wall structural protein 1-like [Ipomoea nil]
MLMHTPLPCTKPPDDDGGGDGPSVGDPGGEAPGAPEGPICICMGGGGESIDGPGLMLAIGGVAVGAIGGAAMGADGGGAAAIGGAAIGATVMGGGAVAIGGAALGAAGVIFGGEAATDGGIVTPPPPPPPGGEAMGD